MGAPTTAGLLIFYTQRRYIQWEANNKTYMNCNLGKLFNHKLD